MIQEKMEINKKCNDPTQINQLQIRFSSIRASNLQKRNRLYYQQNVDKGSETNMSDI